MASAGIAPTVSIKATPASINYGGTTVISWSSNNAYSCKASGGWAQINSKSGTFLTPSLIKTVTYAISCTGRGGTTKAYTKVLVGSAPAPTLTLTATPPSIAYHGSSNLTWSSTNTKSCTASGEWSGTKPTSGTFTTLALTTTANYTLTCTGIGGTATQSTP